MEPEKLKNIQYDPVVQCEATDINVNKDGDSELVLSC